MKILKGKEEDYKKNKEVNTDPYGAGIIRYYEKWADLMEEEMKKGKYFHDIVESTSREADTEGIIGYMFGVAVNILSQIWEYGDELKDWHNNKYNYIGNGIVNPAIITIST